MTNIYYLNMHVNFLRPGYDTCTRHCRRGSNLGPSDLKTLSHPAPPVSKSSVYARLRTWREYFGRRDPRNLTLYHSSDCCRKMISTRFHTQSRALYLRVGNGNGTYELLASECWQISVLTECAIEGAPTPPSPEISDCRGLCVTPVCDRVLMVTRQTLI